MNRLTQEEFIKKCVKKHGNKYDYSQVVYVNSKSKINIICKKHGIFIQSASGHSSGNGCTSCFYEEAGNRYSDTKEEFINKAVNVHGEKYNYSLVEYKNSQTKVDIICSYHGCFKQLPLNHLKGFGCAKCANKIVDTENFIKKAIETHGDKFDYSKVEFKNSITKVLIKCSVHGDFLQLPKIHLRGAGCQMCRESKGEASIKQFLNFYSINYVQEYSFVDCKNKNNLFFDFYLPDLNILIEYDGIQHYEPIIHFGGNKKFLEIKKKDEIKNKYCIYNNIKLIRIKYDENCEDKLKLILK